MKIRIRCIVYYTLQNVHNCFRTCPSRIAALALVDDITNHALKLAGRDGVLERQNLQRTVGTVGLVWRLQTLNLIVRKTRKARTKTKKDKHSKERGGRSSKKKTEDRKQRIIIQERSNAPGYCLGIK